MGEFTCGRGEGCEECLTTNGHCTLLSEDSYVGDTGMLGKKSK